MKKTVVLSSLLLAMLTGCKENTTPANSENPETPRTEQTESNEDFKLFTEVEIHALNDLVSENNLKEPEAVVRHLFPEEMGAEGNYSYTITTLAHTEDHIVLQLIEDQIMDDSILAIKTIMSFKLTSTIPQITEVKRNFKCRLERGHQEWSTRMCE